MKIKWSVLLVALLISSAGAEATQRTVRKTPQLPDEFSSPQSSSTRLGAGVTTINVIGLSPALSGLLEIQELHSLQFVFGIDFTSPTLEFGAGTAYRYILAGNQAAGFHVGGGIDLGTILKTGTTTNVFYVVMGPIAGLNFTLPGLNKINFSLDAGANFVIRDGAFNFNLGPLSDALGLSMHYMF